MHVVISAGVLVPDEKDVAFISHPQLCAHHGGPFHVFGLATDGLQTRNQSGIAYEITVLGRHKSYSDGKLALNVESRPHSVFGIARDLSNNQRRARSDGEISIPGVSFVDVPGARTMRLEYSNDHRPHDYQDSRFQQSFAAHRESSFLVVLAKGGMVRGELNFTRSLNV